MSDQSLNSTNPLPALTSASAADLLYIESGGTAYRITYANLTASISLGVASGGTGITSYAVGDILYASGATTLSKLADVSAGSFLRSGGVTTAPAWSTTKWTNSATTGDLLYASAANTYSNLAAVAAGAYLRSAGTSTAPVWSTTTLPNSATAGDLLYASASNVYSNLADVATGSLLASGGVGVAPAWSASPTLTTSLTCPTLYGGTGAGSTLTLKGTSSGSPSAANVLMNTVAAGVSPGAVLMGPASAASLTNLTNVLQLQGADATGSAICLDSYGTIPSTFVLRTAGGTAASPTATASGVVLGAFGTRSYETTTPGFTAFNSARIAMIQSQAATNAAQGTYITLETTQKGAVASTRNTRLLVGGDATLTDAATDLFDITLNSGEMAGGSVIWTIIASNGTDHQAFSGVSYFSAVNKAAAYTTNISDHTVAANTNSKSVSSGTLTAAFTFNNGTNKVTFRVTPAGSLTETVYKIIYTVINNSPAAITVL